MTQKDAHIPNKIFIQDGNMHIALLLGNGGREPEVSVRNTQTYIWRQRNNLPQTGRISLKSSLRAIF